MGQTFVLHAPPGVDPTTGTVTTSLLGTDLRYGWAGGCQVAAGGSATGANTSGFTLFAGGAYDPTLGVWITSGATQGSWTNGQVYQDGNPVGGANVLGGGWLFGNVDVDVVSPIEPVGVTVTSGLLGGGAANIVANVGAQVIGWGGVVGVNALANAIGVNQVTGGFGGVILAGDMGGVIDAFMDNRIWFIFNGAQVGANWLGHSLVAVGLNLTAQQQLDLENSEEYKEAKRRYEWVPHDSARLVQWWANWLALEMVIIAPGGAGACGGFGWVCGGGGGAAAGGGSQTAIGAFTQARLLAGVTNQYLRNFILNHFRAESVKGIGGTVEVASTHVLKIAHGIVRLEKLLAGKLGPLSDLERTIVTNILTAYKTAMKLLGG